MAQSEGLQIVGLGEAVFDVFEDQTILGGAPLNVAACAHQCVAATGGAGIVASRVGRDTLGRQLIREFESRGMETKYIQLDSDRPTGKVIVSFENHQPHYEICKPAAWDALQLDRRWVKLAQTCDAVCFGTLAQRCAVSREAVERFLRSAPNALRLLDVNLRQEFYSTPVLESSFQHASAVKLNEEELATICPLLGFEGESPDTFCNQLLEKYDLCFVALTLGAHGIRLFTSEGIITAEPEAYPMQDDADTVGAGDAAAVGMMIGFCHGWPPPQTLDLACHLGGYLASVSGATPTLPSELVRRAAQSITD